MADGKVVLLIDRKIMEISTALTSWSMLHCDPFNKRGDAAGEPGNMI